MITASTSWLAAVHQARRSAHRAAPALDRLDRPGADRVDQFAPARRSRRADPVVAVGRKRQIEVAQVVVGLVIDAVDEGLAPAFAAAARRSAPRRYSAGRRDTGARSPCRCGSPAARAAAPRRLSATAISTPLGPLPTTSTRCPANCLRIGGSRGRADSARESFPRRGWAADRDCRSAPTR